MNKKIFIDAHCHLVNFDHVTPSVLVNKLFQKGRIISDLTYFLSLFGKSSRQRLVNILEAFEVTIDENFKTMKSDLDSIELISDYKKVIIPLMLDFQTVAPREEFNTQKTALEAAIRNLEHNSLYVFPFLALERKENGAIHDLKTRLENAFTKIIEKKKLSNGDCIGIKIYPPFGFDLAKGLTDGDEFVTTIVDFCLQYDIPFTTHCGKAGFNIDDHSEMKSDPDPIYKFLKNNPKYKNIRYNLAHFGGKITRNSSPFSSWSKIVTKMIKEFPNIYADISYLGDERVSMKNLVHNIRKDKVTESKPWYIKNKTIFGSDYFLVLVKTSGYRQFLKRSLKLLKNDFFLQFSSENTLNFLGPAVVTLLPDDLLNG